MDKKQTAGKVVSQRRSEYFKRTWIRNPAFIPAAITVAVGSIAVGVIWYHHLVRGNSVSINPNKPRQYFVDESPLFFDQNKVREKLVKNHELESYVPKEGHYHTRSKTDNVDYKV